MRVLGWFFAIIVLAPLAMCIYVMSAQMNEAEWRKIDPHIQNSLGVENIIEIVDKSRNNQAYFDQNYKGKKFDGSLPFNSIVRPISDYQVHFYPETEAFIDHHGVYCFITGGIDRTKPLLEQIASWKKGRLIHVQGTINTTNFGELQLNNCAAEEVY